MGLVLRLVIQEQRSGKGNVTILRHIMEGNGAKDLIRTKRHATLMCAQSVTIMEIAQLKNLFAMLGGFAKSVWLTEIKEMVLKKETALMVTCVTLMGHAEKVYCTNYLCHCCEKFKYQNGCKRINKETILTDPCKVLTCPGETCDELEGVCKCNTSNSCIDNEKGAYCDLANSQCKCAQNIDACSNGQQCIKDECKDTCSISNECPNGYFCDGYHCKNAEMKCERKKGIANNDQFTRDLIGYTDSFVICFLSRPENKFNGFTWNEKTHECFGIENALSINNEYECCDSCVFNGKLVFASLHSLSCDYNLVIVVMR